MVAKLTFQYYNKAILSQTGFNQFCFLRNKSNEIGREGEVRNRRQ